MNYLNDIIVLLQNILKHIGEGGGGMTEEEREKLTELDLKVDEISNLVPKTWDAGFLDIKLEDSTYEVIDIAQREEFSDVFTNIKVGDTIRFVYNDSMLGETEFNLPISQISDLGGVGVVAYSLLAIYGMSRLVVALMSMDFDTGEPGVFLMIQTF